MKNADEIVSGARETLEIEANAVRNLANNINDDYVAVIERIHDSNGRVVITGIGKSANIAKKIVATLNSTGTPAIFMHAADAIHGDLGSVQADDVVICISNSGNTPEIKGLIPLIKNMGNTLVGMVGNMDSTLAKQANHVLNTTVDREACPNNLAPTSSTTAQLAMGDAVAVSLMKYRGFSDEDFAKNHPGGALGKKLYLRLSNLLDGEEPTTVQHSDNISEVIMKISSGRKGAAAVLDGDSLVGIITDGDLRRMLEKSTNIDDLVAGDIMNPNPKKMDADTLAVKAFTTMEQHKITQVLVLEDEKLAGIIHLHDILNAGIY